LKKKTTISDGNDLSEFLARETEISDHIFDHTGSIFGIINRHNVYLKVNSSFSIAHRSEQGSPAGKSVRDIWGDDLFKDLIKSNIDLCFSGKTVRYEIHLNTPQSEEKFFEVVLRPIPDKTGQISFLSEETIDRTDLRQSEMKTLEMEKELLKLECKLLQSQKYETIGAMAGGVSHDLNNVLATISGYSEMLMDDLPEDSESSEIAGRILGAVTKARSITNQLLTFNQHVVRENVPVNVTDVINETLELIKSAVPSGVVVTHNIPAKNVFVVADSTQLFRVFLNLITNALQAMEKTGGTLSVNLEVVKGNLVEHKLNKDKVAEEYVLLTFKDTGTGMDPRTLTRIFEPFFTTREPGKGTGLGLSVIHGIIKELEGEIFVTSEKQQGSSFYVYLPVSGKET
jgi:signal transduction histidine kinase